MSDFSDLDVATAAVEDPETPAADLAEIAAQQPTLQAQVANHPAVYPDLLDWLGNFGSEDAKAAVAKRRPPPPEMDEDTDTVLAPLVEAEPTFTAAMTQLKQPEYAPPYAPIYPPAYDMLAPYPVAKGHRLAWIIVGVVALLVAVALVLTFAVFLPASQAENKFNDAVASFQQKQADLSAKISAAQVVAGYYTADELDNPATLDSLNAAIQSAKPNTTDPVPVMASGTSEINQQTSDLQAKTDAMQTQIDSLTNDSQALQDSALSWAKATLSAAIDDANATYAQYSYSPDQASLNNLLDQITQAGQVLDGLDNTDPSSYASAIQASMNSLSAAQATVAATAPVKCGDVILPYGVDPMVCGGMPPGARTFPLVEGLFRMFEMPSHNIGCYDNGYGISNAVTCEIKSHSWAFPADLWNQCQIETNYGWDYGCDASMVLLSTDGTVSVGAHGDEPPWTYAKAINTKVPLLQYGQKANFGTAACLSASDGVTCWDIYTHHGFKTNMSAFMHW